MPTWNPPAAPPPASNEHYSVSGNWTGGLPTNTTDAIFDGSVSNRNCIINTTGLVCFNFTIQNGYNGTITFTNTLTVRGSITFITSVNFSGPNGLTCQSTVFPPATLTYNSNNKAFNLPLILSHNTITINFINTWTVTNFTSSFISGNPHTYNGGIVNVTGNLTIAQPTSTSTTQFVLAGTGTFATSQNWSPPTEINTSGAITVNSIILTNGCLFKYTTASSVTVTGTMTVGIATLDLQDLPFNDFLLRGNGTVALLSNANFNNATFGDGNGTGVQLNGAGLRFNVRGNFRVGQASGFLAGTGIVCLKGSGTLSSFGANGVNTTGAIGVDLELNTSGTYTVTSNISVAGASKYFTRTNGLINWSTFTLFINTNGRTFTTAGITFNNVTTGTAITTTITNLFTIAGTLSIAGGITTFTGTAGWTCGTLTCSTPGTAIVLQSGITYTTTTNVIMLGTNANRITMRSNAPTVSYAIWTLQNPATQSMVYVNAQGVDSNAGMSIYSFQGVILTSLPALNWFNGASQGTKAFTFVN
jgi:hypothetical protein